VKERRFSLTTPENSEQDIQDDGNDKSAKERLGTAAPAPKPERQPALQRKRTIYLE
jgi:hypothetical protein